MTRVEVRVEADGSSKPRLVTSTGERELDQAVLEYLKAITWQPALQDGLPIASVTRFKVVFSVEGGPEKPPRPSARPTRTAFVDPLPAGMQATVFAHVRVHADGTFEPLLRTSTGDAEFDARVLDWLRTWTWQPATVDGRAVETVERFEVDLRADPGK